MFEFQWLYICLEEKDVVKIYGNRWNIEIIFKVSKNLPKLEKEFKKVNFDMMISHISIVFTKYIMLECLKKANNDFRYGSTNLGITRYLMR